jgi:4-amino-4-deoxy-L-arabinose transferase-like glycosyltransferase
MPGSEDFIQRVVHTLEVGGLAVWLRRLLVAAIVCGIAVFHLYSFRGLATSQAMDQAQIGRQIASGHGWATNFARPRAIGQLIANRKNVEKNVWTDTYNAPLPPLLNAIALWPVKAHWKIHPNDIISAGDKAIATMSIIIFLLSVLVVFFLARRLFDQRLAYFACALVLFCDMIWQYSLSGLPQMLLLFLFNVTLYLMLRAVQAKFAVASSTVDGTVTVEPEPQPVIPWLAAAGIGFGLLALTHALTIWIFVPALIFSVFFFRPRGWAAAVLLVAFAIVYFPWLIRNYAVSGNPAGVAVYSILDGINSSEAGWMRRLQVDFSGIGPPAFFHKVIDNLISQSGRIFSYLGSNVVAAAFFFSLLHAFKRPETAAIRWLTLGMWAGATLGIAFYGIKEEQGFAANQLHLIFIPIMICYGFAFLHVQWNRLEIQFPFARGAFVALLFLLCSFPMLNTMVLSGRKPLIMWPPYLPPLIGFLNNWMEPNEITASDMPWAVAWYADRRSVWLPDTTKNFAELSDYNALGGKINGLYLTPVSGTQNNLRDIVKGEYKDWAPLIERTVELSKFPIPLKWATVSLGLESECVFFSDHDRSQEKTK